MKTTPYWWDDCAHLVNLPTEPPEKTELLIIGAGYTGLSAAITAAQKGAQVTVVDAGIPGEGASTRNGGMAGAHPRLSLAAMSKKFGAETAKGMFNEAPKAFAYLKALITDHNFDCEYQNSGRVQLAWTRADFAAQVALADDMNRNTDFSVEVLQREDVKDHVKTDQYFGGLFYRDHGALHPRKLHDGMVTAALGLGVQLVQSCPIQAVLETATGFRAETAKGNISARKVILATNGYTQGKGTLEKLTARVFPLPSYILATEPLPAKLIKELAPGGRMMVETRARHSYWRISPDGTRILWGGRAAIRNINPRQAADRLRETMGQIWPALANVGVSHSWRGNTGFTFNNAPHVGQLDGLNFAMGYCGGGVVLAPYLGHKVALQTLGDADGITAYSQTRLATKPYFWGGRPWFLNIADRWYNLVIDPRQYRQAERDHAQE